MIRAGKASTHCPRTFQPPLTPTTAGQLITIGTWAPDPHVGTSPFSEGLLFEWRRHELLWATEGSESSRKHSWAEAQRLQNGRPQSAQPILGHKRG